MFITKLVSILESETIYLIFDSIFKKLGKD